MIETSIDGRYQILARIAAGGMGEVFRAHDPVLDREVALKMLHVSLADDPSFIDRFRREARSAATLSHPNIVGVHDWGTTQGTYFMVMEFVRGVNLRAILMKHGALDAANAVSIVSDVLAALEHAHAQGIVHRDIKPENIMVRASDGAVKVADFGLARAFADSRVSQAPGTVTGTVQYLAPEQIEGMPADPRTDLYATGIVLYELLTGDVPFSGETSMAIAWRHLRERVPPPSRANPGVPVSLDRVVLNATERDREKRTDDAAVMRTDLQRADAELPPAAPLAELAAAVTPADEVPADRLSTVTIPRTLSPKERRRQRVSRAFRFVSIAAVVGLLGWAAWTFVIPHPTTVPDLRGDPLARAEAEADEAGLDLVLQQEFNSDVPDGAVVSQSLAPGTEAERGDGLTVVPSLGPELAAVPSVEGLTREEALARLDEARFEYKIVREYHETVPEDRVISQNPQGATELEVGKQIRLTVSKGLEPVDLPSLAGQTEAEAKDALKNLNLALGGISREFSAAVVAGEVIRTAPAAGQTVEQESKVVLVVSKGPRTFAMPSVIGKPSSQARAELESLDLVVSVKPVPGSEGDLIVGQIPKAGTIVQQGSTVTLYVGG
ncbi:MAG: Stk1 family PASTA domain-containing Ser/Thr kinase [Actinomycetota bacterium]